ncbi:MAG: cytochrome c maturation protein CcmE [Caldilineales bacterium]|nr:cytochrome c maturation protein CcmE [Caldilineales bacterium]
MTTQGPSLMEIKARPRKNKYKTLAGGLMIVIALTYLIFTATANNAQYYMTVDELLAQADTLEGRNVRVSGAVVGETVQYNLETLELTFEIAQMPGSPSDIDKAGGLAEALRAAVNNPDAQRITVHYVGPKSDLLRNEAAAITTGTLQDDGVFHANEVLFKCPTRYEDAPPAPAA